MIESLLAWSCLVIGAFGEEPVMMIASAMFAVAAQISRIVDRMDGEK